MLDGVQAWFSYVANAIFGMKTVPNAAMSIPKPNIVSICLYYRSASVASQDVQSEMTLSILVFPLKKDRMMEKNLPFLIVPTI